VIDSRWVVTKKNVFPLIPLSEGKKGGKNGNNFIFTFVQNFILNKRLVIIANLSLSLSS
jgi:hypothetical protein